MDRFTNLYPDLVGQPVVLYAPTFRARAGNTDDPIDPLELTRALRAAGFMTVTKLHPLVTPPRHPELYTVPGMSTQDLMLVADVFVTDYSSAVFEAAVAGVPCYLLAPDLDQYVQSRDFYLAYPQDLGLPLARSVDELVTSIRVGTAVDIQTERLRARFVDLDGDGTAETDEALAADRLARLLAPHWGAPGA